MKKPINGLALVTWVLAAGILAVYAFYDLDSWHATTLTKEALPNSQGPGNPYSPLIHEIGTDIFRVVLLIAVGAIVELIDQIRWNAIQSGKAKL